MDHLDHLEYRSVHIFREAYAAFKNLAMLWSIGKDSTVLLWLARKAFFGHVPFPLVHIDTSFKIPEMIAYRDRLAAEWRLNLIYGQNSEALADKRTFPDGAVDRLTCCGLLKTEALKHTLSGEWPRYRFNHATKTYEIDRDTEPFTGVIVGARADEEGSRSKERYFSPRNGRISGMSRNSRPSSGTSTRPISHRERTSASTRCSTGPSSISGSTSSANRSRWSTCISIAETAVVTVRSAADPARVGSNPMHALSPRSPSSFEAAASRTSRNGPGARRMQPTEAGSRPCGVTGTCSG